jgi:spoIIIJ-associated protein
MEWVEVTGRTLAEAKEAALDQLGVAEVDAEVIVLAEPNKGLFGRMRGEARVRARVRPAGPRPKRGRRPRERGNGSRSGGGSGGRGSRTGSSSVSTGAGTGGGRSGQDIGDGEQSATRSGGVAADTKSAGSGAGKSRSARRRRARRGGSRAGTDVLPAEDGSTAAAAAALGISAAGAAGRSEEEEGMAEGMTLQEQGDVAREFLEGLLQAYGLEGSVSTRILDEETVEVAATGQGLGLLVGPRGSTLAALQDVTRTVVQRHFPTRTDRILVDVAGYRERRVAALQRFSRQVAEEVLGSGSERVLEPMSPADRKVVHDTVNTIDGVGTRSEGDEPARYIVIHPAAAEPS